jgi:hypothetical protein
MHCLLENGVNVRKSSIVSIIEPHQFSLRVGTTGV